MWSVQIDMLVVEREGEREGERKRGGDRERGGVRE